ncbi:MAG: lipopolysaccharide biosynthesis protein [Thermotoga sp. 4484_232]|nr:WecB/TagA/CpsF family glycosyltransferase [Thermotogaceae bacterium]OQX56941.1 MAG: lipopolysaccharide biosynthesis protein [Thermotoga sp. 4484_232]RKX53982.1 MAG: glycosyltransferase [Thermotoga sp.]HDG62305.1 glycosyltransferase [Thermotoga sp.]
MKKSSLFGIEITYGKREEIISEIERRLNNGEKMFIVTLNVSILMEAMKDPSYRKILEEASMVIPDGSGIVWALDVIANVKTDRVTGIDTMTHLCELSKRKGWKVYLLGAREDVAKKACENLRRNGVNVVGYHHGYFEKDGEVIVEILSKKPDLLFVGMGVPKQERWIHEHFKKIPVRLAMGVGGSIDVVSGRKKRAPEFVQKMKLEWLYRFLQSPWNKRKIPFQIMKFVFLVLRERKKRKRWD